MSLAETEERLDKLKADLRDLSSTYGDKYPEVRRMKDQISQRPRHNGTSFWQNKKLKVAIPSPMQGRPHRSRTR